MNRKASAQEKKYFSPQEADSMLPLVRAIVADAVRTFREVNERRERLAVIKGEGGRTELAEPYREELQQVEEDLMRDVARLQEYVEELRALGVEPKNFSMGLVDFPTRVGGQEAYLCWRLDEPQVQYWHELDAGFAGRQPLPAESHSPAGSAKKTTAEQQAAGDGSFWEDERAAVEK